jgi:hypothetical protein
MLPDNVVSSIAFGGLYMSPDDRVTSSLVDYDRGGVALLDASMGLLSHNWKCYVQGIDVFLQRDGQAPILIFQESMISEMTFTFDQNMRYCVAYIQSGTLKLRWFDPVAGNFVVSSFGSAVNPKITLDDKRNESLNTSDMILAYIQGNSLFYRQQRDRFLIERTLRTGLFPNTRLKNIGMNKNLRMQFELV